MIKPPEQEQALPTVLPVEQTDQVQEALKQEQELRAFFREKLLPAAERGKQRGFCFLPGMAEAESWYVAYPPNIPELVEESAATSEEALRQLWEKEGFPELADLAGPLIELRSRLKPTAEETEGDVSPFIYAMF